MIKHSKYNSKKVITNEGKFDSKKEYKRWLELKDMEARGEIRELKRQYPLELIPSQRIDGRVVERACKYIADFVYVIGADEVVIEDTKGFKTPDYIIKRKLVLQRYGIQIKEV